MSKNVVMLNGPMHFLMVVSLQSSAPGVFPSTLPTWQSSYHRTVDEAGHHALQAH
jgi:hypothetical protein